MGVTPVPVTGYPGDKTNFPKVGDSVKIHYVGAFPKEGVIYKEELEMDSLVEEEFDSSWGRRRPFECKIGVGQLIRGWDEGILGISLGEAAYLPIPSDYGYGKVGFGSLIPPNSDLVFLVELIGINDLSVVQPSNLGSLYQKSKELLRIKQEEEELLRKQQEEEELLRKQQGQKEQKDQDDKKDKKDA